MKVIHKAGDLMLKSKAMKPVKFADLRATDSKSTIPGSTISIPKRVLQGCLIRCFGGLVYYSRSEVPQSPVETALMI